MADMRTRFVNGVAKTTGWTRDFTGDLLGTVGGAMVAFFATDTLITFIPYSGVTAACITSAMLWKRFRRDNV